MPGSLTSPGVDDFAAARNAALDHATGDYAFWLDADDVIDAGPKKKLASLFRTLDGGGGYRLTLLVNKLDPADPESRYWSWQSLRLFPLRPDLRWTYRIHERIQPALDRAGIPLCDTNIQVRHTGYEDHALFWSKLDRNDRLVSLALAERPHDPYLLALAADAALRSRDLPRAARYVAEARTTPVGGFFGTIVRAKLDEVLARIRVAELVLSGRISAA